MKTTHLLVSFFAITVISLSCQKEKSFEGEAYTLRLNFQPSANGEPLQFNKEYINPIGEDYKVTSFKFYVSKISLLQELPTPVARKEDGFFLVDASKPASQIIEVQLNSNPFTRLMFQIGIDSIYNVSGAQTGALDPLNGMFWTWNSGYIMAKLEGSSSLSSGLNNTFTYHIGGFRDGEKTQREIVLPLPNQPEWVLEKTNITEMVIDVNLDKWFRSKNDLPISSIAEHMSPGPIAIKYADNYANLFTLNSVVRK
jgi:hypothetical protein